MNTDKFNPNDYSNDIINKPIENDMLNGNTINIHSLPKRSEEMPNTIVASVIAPYREKRESSTDPYRERDKRGWGPKYQPEVEGIQQRKIYQRICEDIIAELCLLDEYITDGILEDESAPIIAEIEALIETLYNCSFGQSSSLKAVIVAIQSQINNIIWTIKHFNFLKAVFNILRNRYVINDQTVDEIYDIIQEYDLEPFRGTLTETEVKVRYRLEKVED